MPDYVVTSQEMRRHERFTCQEKNRTIQELIDSAGKQLYRHFSRYFPAIFPERRMVILAGPGNNGQDALSFCQFAVCDGWAPTLLLYSKKMASLDVVKTIQSQCSRMTLYILEEGLPIAQILNSDTIVVDGLFGSGLDRPIEGECAALIDAINHAKAFVYALDLPSGLHADTGVPLGHALHASVTGIIQYYKLGHLLNDGMDLSGETELLDIGLILDPSCPKRLHSQIGDILPWFRKRPRKSHKHDYGKLLIIGGSPGMMGAPELAAASALHSGVGVVNVAVSVTDIPFFHPFYPEVMHVFYHTPDELNDVIETSDAILFGPGLGRFNVQAETLMERLLASLKPLIIDADGLAYLKPHLNALSKASRIIVTPHLKEMASLLDTNLTDLAGAPERYVPRLTSNDMTVVLKAHWTLVASSYEMTYLTSGNPGMATAGSGDVLAGIIAAFVAGKDPLFVAAQKGVLVHQEAGRLARALIGEAGMIASDLVAKIATVLQNLNRMSDFNDI